jgi:hypothetical protein
MDESHRLILYTNSNAMFITNSFADSDKACQIAMANYKKQIERENHYRQQVRDGIIPAPNYNYTQTWDISDRD